ncbi:MFS transporter [Burkholderia plantarii]|uniref:MFS transporter n=1 Tax=Burkholderia plantarii TaxID=41899 RepID=UPI00272C8401|nr:MFS transporter [Burkholderia plantarii]WLE59896.1 MFS transporter [Burkholderia plantarii]
MTTDSADVAPPLSAPRIHAIFAGLVLVMLLGTIDQAIVAPALAPIAAEFGRFADVSWVVTGYLLTSTAATPLAGRLSDRHGRRAVILGALLVFLAGSVACAIAPGLAVLVLGRALQGLGGGALMTLPNTVIADILSPRERGRYQIYISATYATSSAAGPILGGWLADAFSWRWIFWINVPLVAAACLASWATLGRLPARRARVEMDYRGALLMGSATICLLVALTRPELWATRRVLAVLLAGAALLLGTGFVAWQRRARSPLLPPALLRNRVMVVTSVGGVAIAMVNMALSIFIPLFLQLCRGMTVAGAGTLLVGLLLGVVGGAYSSGQYLRHTGRYRAPSLYGLAAAVVVLALLAGSLHAVTPPLLVAATAVAGAGIGACYPPMMVTSQSAARGTDVGIATGVHTFFRALGGTFGAALFSMLLVAALGAQAPLLSAAHARAAAPVLPPPQLYEVERAFSWLFALCAATLGIGWASLYCLPERALRGTAASLDTGLDTGLAP